MLIRPSIVIEGASRAADWIPYATSMLRGMTYDGTTNYAPEDGITIVITRHGSVAKIYIRADYPEGGRFAGIPYTALNTSGWGTPYDEDNPIGTPGSTDHTDVILDKNKGAWAAKRYPEYARYYSDLEYGNMDWTSADGQTVLTWDGPNSPHASEMTYNLKLAGACCVENVPDNDWHIGYHYPGFKSCYSASCHLVVYLPHKVRFVDSQEPTDYEDAPMFGSKVYMNGKVLVIIRAAGEYNFEANLAETKDLEVFGAAIQEVSEDDGSITKYLLVMLGQYAVVEGGGQAAGYKTNDEYLFRAPLNDLTNFAVTRMLEEFTLSGGGQEGLSPWCFNSTATEAVAVRGSSGYYNAFKVSIDKEGIITGELLHAWSDRVPRWVAPNYPSRLDAGESYRYECEGAGILAIGYKDDVIRYGCVYKRAWTFKSFERDNPADPLCDIMYSTLETYEEIWFAFVDDLDEMSDTIPGAFKINTEHDTHVETTYGGVSGTPENPALIISITKKQELKHPIFIDCRYDMVLFQTTTEPNNTFNYGFIANGSPAFLMREISQPSDYSFITSVDFHIAGVQVYESTQFIQKRSPGDCFETSIYSLDGGYSCDLTEYFLNLVGDPDGNAVYPVNLFGSVTATIFCNIQTHKNDPEKPDFDILFTMRTKYSDPDMPSESFIARWDGATLADRQDISTLLDIDDDGVLANTGKI